MPNGRLQRARLSLLGLCIGDALGSQFFIPGNRHHLASRSLPPAPWQWTDDTEMACSVYLTLATHHTIDQDALAASFAKRHDFDRGYGPATNRMLGLVRDGGDWRSLAAGLFDGSGSWGNGAAMRVAPVGAYFAGDPAEAARQGALSATVTHATLRRWPGPSRSPWRRHGPLAGRCRPARSSTGSWSTSRPGRSTTASPWHAAC